MTLTFNRFLILAAVVLFAIGALAPLFGTLDADADHFLLFGGLTLFAAGHLT